MRRASVRPNLTRSALRDVGRAFAIGAFAVTLALGAGKAISSCAPRVASAKAPTMPSPQADLVVTGAMIALPAGEYLMGSHGGDDDEKPVRRVAVDAFAIDRTEVTVAAYAACVASGACAVPDTGSYCNWSKREARAHHPINCVSWTDASAFCGWAGKRLPSEVEWEYAARGRAARKFPWGDAAPGAQLCWDGPGSDVQAGTRRGTCEVGAHPAGRTVDGADDMAGNVLEWTADAYTDSYASGSSPTHKVNRGGSWVTFDKHDVRNTQRLRSSTGRRDFTIGFRCAR